MIDFSKIASREMKFSELAKHVSKEELKASSDESIDNMLGLLVGLTDADVSHEPTDDDANDPYAVEGEEGIGWTFGHLIAHVTASSEEGAAFSSVLARGHALAERPRYETPWGDLDSVAKCKQRLEESRRMRNAYLATWPDDPHLDVYREGMTEGFLEFTGRLNAIGSFLLGLGHEVGHFAQLEDAKAQALAARSA